MAKRGVFDKGQSDYRLAKQGESGHAIAGGQPVFDNGIPLKGKGTDKLFVAFDIACCLVQVARCKPGIFREEIGVHCCVTCLAGTDRVRTGNKVDRLERMGIACLEQSVVILAGDDQFIRLGNTIKALGQGGGKREVHVMVCHRMPKSGQGDAFFADQVIGTRSPVCCGQLPGKGDGLLFRKSRDRNGFLIVDIYWFLSAVLHYHCLYLL